MKHVSFLVGDVIRWGGRSWRISAVCLGALNQQSIVQLVNDDSRSVGNDHDGKPVLQMTVPEEVLVAAVTGGAEMEHLRRVAP